MNSTRATADRDRSAHRSDASDDSGAGRPMRRRRWYLLIIALVAVVVIGGVRWWWLRSQEEVEQVSVRPVAVCHGLYETAELDRILGSRIGSADVVPYGPWVANCIIFSELRAAADATDGRRNEIIVNIYFRERGRYDTGYGVRWTDESMAADSEYGVQQLDIPELEGNTYLWVAERSFAEYVHGVWFADEFTVGVVVNNPDGSVDGPMSVQAAIDVMPELLAYVGTNTLKHPALPKGDPSGTSVAPAPSEAPVPTETADEVEDSGVDPVIVITPTAS